MTKFTDGGMFEGIKAFQKDNKLKVDGIMKPQGETESKINALQKLKENHIQQKNLISPTNSYPQNLKNWIAEKDRVSKMKISDVNKHQYMSCLAGKGGKTMAVTGASLGALKEGYDLSYKSLNPKKRKDYKGLSGVYGDSLKDMYNNIYGLKYGLKKDTNCSDLIKKIP